MLKRNKPIKVFGTGKGEVIVSFLGDATTLVIIIIDTVGINNF